MAEEPNYLPLEIRPQWLALRRKHEEATTRFQSKVRKEEEEFKTRVERAKENLLEKHTAEEHQFWAKHGRAKPSKTTATAPADPAPKQAPNTAKFNAKSARMSTIPKTVAVPPRKQQIHTTTPVNASPHQRTLQVPLALKRTTQKVAPKPGQKFEKIEVIDLCSDDEAGPPAQKKQAVVQERPAQVKPIHNKQASQAMVTDAMEIDGIPQNTTFSMPEASIELFGTTSVRSMVRMLSPHQSHILTVSQPMATESHVKTEHDGSNNPKNTSPHIRGGLADTERAAIAQQASTATPHLESWNRPLAPRRPASFFGQGTWKGFGSSFASRMFGSPAGITGLSSPFTESRASNIAPEVSGSFSGSSDETSWREGSVQETRITPKALGAADPVTPSVDISPSPSPSEHTGSDDDDHQSIAATGAPRGNQQQEQTQPRQLPSPPPPSSHVSVFPEPLATTEREVATNAPTCKTPNVHVPARTDSNTVRRPVASQARLVRAGTLDSRASSVAAVPASRRTGRAPWIVSGATNKRKRGMDVSLSSDEDEGQVSDYAPSDESDSPIARPRASAPRRRPSKNVHTANKTKANTDGAAARPVPRAERLMAGKNEFGFKAKKSIDRRPKLRG
ncbi:hypothetical protein ACEQ8H_003404 [Pleosporales sp. CAS-2024a]